MLHYALCDNELTVDDPDDQIDRPVDVVSNKREDLVNDVTGPGSILKPTKVNASIDAYWEKITAFVREGETYSDEYISTRFDISGVFIDKDDRFDSSHHALTVIIKIKPAVSKAAEEVELKKVDGRKNQPDIDSIYDWGSNRNNEQLTPNDVLEISGEMLKIYHNLEDEEGVFFMNQSDGTETRQGELRTNEPKTLTLRIPALTARNYRLEVRNTRHDGKVLRTGVFTPILTDS